MQLFRSIASRDLQPELMDQPDLDGKSHQRALAGLARINYFSNSAGILWREIRRRSPDTNGESLRIFDVASGGGDVSLGLWQRARRDGIAVEVTALEISQTAIDHASNHCRKVGSNIKFVQADVLQEPFPSRPDVITCSLFLHHLAELDAVKLLKKFADARPRLILVSDLRRSVRGYWLAHAACRLLTRSPVVRFDGPQSVAAAFSIPEVRGLCEQAGLDGAEVARRWPFRLLVSWSA